MLAVWFSGSPFGLIGQPLKSGFLFTIGIALFMKALVNKSIGAHSNHKEKLLDELVERAKPYVRASLAEWLEQILEQPILSTPSSPPLRLTFKDFVKLSDDEQRAWRHHVLDLEEQWLVGQLAKRKAEWLLIVGGKVVKSSSSLEKLPAKKEIYRIAREQGFAPFLYIKDLLIEESEVSIGRRALFVQSIRREKRWSVASWPCACS